jgi:tetratricopeptide (TPR) repeat protein
VGISSDLSKQIFDGIEQREISNTIISLAVDYFEEVKKEKTSPELLRSLGLGYLLRGEYEKAIENLERAKKADPRIDVQRYLGNTYTLVGAEQIQTHNYRKAIDYLEKATENIPNSVDALNLKSQAHFNLEEYDKVIESLEIVTEIELENKDVWNILAVSHFRLDNVDRAAHCFERELEIDPKSFDSWFTLGTIYLNRLLKFEKASEAFSNALSIEASDKIANLRKAEALICTGNLQKAYQQALNVYQSADEPKIRGFALFLMICPLVLMGKKRDARKHLYDFVNTYQEYPERIKIEDTELKGIVETIYDANIEDAERDFLRSIMRLLRNRLDKETFIKFMGIFFE